MPSVTFSHIALACRDQDVTESFYTRYFGFRRTRVVPLPDQRVVILRSGDMHLELFHAREDNPLPLQAPDGPWFPSLRHLAFQVADLEAQLAAMGSEAVITLGPLRFDEFIPGWRSVFLKDPDGVSVEISQGYADPGASP